MDHLPAASSSNLAHIQGPAFEVPEGTLVDHFKRVVALHPDRTAVKFPGQSLHKAWTYKELDEVSDAVAAGLRQRGMKPGDRVAMFMPSTPYYPIMMIAARKAGLTLVNIMLSSKKDREEKPGVVMEKVHDALKAAKPDYLLTFDVYNFVDICRTAMRGTSLKALVSCSVPDVLHPTEGKLYPYKLAASAIAKDVRASIKDQRDRFRVWREENLTRDKFRAQWDKVKEWPSDAAHAVADGGRFVKAAIFHARLRPSYFHHVFSQPPGAMPTPARKTPTVTRDESLLALARAVGGDPRVITRGTAVDSRVLDFKDLILKGANPEYHDVQPSDLSLLQQTSGTSGSPQFIQTSDENQLANVYQCKAQYHWLNLDPEQDAHETMLTVLPGCHSYPHEVGIWFPLLTGSELVLFANPYDTPAFLKAVTRYQPSMMLLSPTLMARILEDEANIRWSDWSSVKAVIPGGSALPERVRIAWENATKMWGRVLPGYGLSEASPVVASNPHPDNNDPETVGRVFAGTEVKIVGPDGRTLNFNQRGLIYVRGPQVSKLGYLDNPEATARTFLPGGWLNTGDLGVIDQNRRLRIVGREKRIALVHSANVSVEDVEIALGRHEDIAQCVAYAVMDETSGETIKAIIRLKKGAEVTVEDITDFLQKQGLDSKAMPRHIEITETDIPLLGSGKPDWKRLQEADPLCPLRTLTGNAAPGAQSAPRMTL